MLQVRKLSRTFEKKSKRFWGLLLFDKEPLQKRMAHPDAEDAL